MRGSVFSYKVKGGKAWGFVHPAAVGSARQIKRRGFKRKADAEKALGASLLKLRTGHTFERGQATLSQAVEEFFAGKAASGTTAKKTGLIDDQALAHLKTSPVADVKLEEIKLDHGQELARHLAALGLGPSTVWIYVSKIRGALNHYTAAGHLIGQPWAKLRVARTKEPMVTLSVEEVARVKSIMAGSLWLDPFTVAVSTGIRRAELLRLTWRDFDGVALNVPASIAKTKRSRRIELFPDALEAILRRRTLERAVALRVKGWNRAGYIFCHHLTGEPLPVESFSANFRKWADRHLKNVRRFRWHDLRHTHASILLQVAKWPLTAVAERLGHASPAMTLRVYSHLLPQSDYLMNQGAEIFREGGQVIEFQGRRKAMTKP